MINELEKSLGKSEQIDQQILLAVSLGDLKNQNVAQQLQEAEKENKHLLSKNIISKFSASDFEYAIIFS